MIEYYFYTYMISLIVGFVSIVVVGVYALIERVKEKKTKGETDELEGS